MGLRDGLISPDLPGEQAPHPPPFADDFAGPGLRREWSFLRGPPGALCQLDPERPGLLLHGSADTVADARTPAFLGVRQHHAWGRVRTTWTFAAQGANEEAGLTFFMNERHHFDGFISRRSGQLHLVIRRCADDLQVEQFVLPLSTATATATATVTLEVDCNPWAYEWFLVSASGDRLFIAKTQNRLLTLQVAGGFIGVMIGLYATGNGHPNRSPARVERFTYEAIPDLVGNFKA